MKICIDFDGTCVTHDYPEVGKSIGAEKVLKKLVDAGHGIILFTMRCDEDLDAASKWFEDNGIPLYGVNANPDQKSWTNSPKAYGHLYIDDAALGAPLTKGEHSRPYIDWVKVEDMLVTLGLLSLEENDPPQK